MPLRWNAKAEREGRRYRVFCASLADVFDNEAPEQWRADLFALIKSTPHLDWLILTKRIGNVRGMAPAEGLPANVWLGAATYKLALYSATDVLIWTVDDITAAATDTLAALAASQVASRRTCRLP